MVSENIEKKELLIIGGGISGLAAAYYLLKGSASPRDFLLLESQAQAGGTIQTHWEKGCLLDGGPDSFITSKPWALDLCRELGLEEELVAPQPEAKKLYFVKNDHLRSLPEGFQLGIPTNFRSFLFSHSLPWSLKLRVGLEFFRISHNGRKNQEDISIGEFFEGHFGKPCVDLLIDPILGGIYAGSAAKISLQSTFPQFLQMEKKYGSLIRGMMAAKKARKEKPSMPLFLSFRKGMATLIQALVKKIPSQHLHLNQKVKAIRSLDPLNPMTGFLVETASGKRWHTKEIILALPSPLAAELFPEDEKLTQILKSFSSASSVSVFLGFSKTAIPQPAKGFGFFIPRTEPTQMLASTWVSSKFPHRSPEDVFILRCFYGGYGREGILSLAKEDIIQLTLDELQKIMGIQAKPLFTKIFYWPKLSPQYEVGHLQRLAELEQRLEKVPGLQIIGNSFGGIGIPNCIHQAQQVVQKIQPRLPFGLSQSIPN